MADYTLEIPGDKSITMNIGDTLKINFKNPAKFCIDSGGNAEAFNPCLPDGELKTGWWPGPDQSETATALSNTTVTYCHVGSDKQCQPCKSPTGGPPGTIKVGTGTK